MPEELTNASIADRLRDVEVGDELVFNDRQKPLEVTEVTERSVSVEGPRGGEYSLFLDGSSVTRPKYADGAGYVREPLQWVKVEVQEAADGA